MNKLSGSHVTAETAKPTELQLPIVDNFAFQFEDAERYDLTINHNAPNLPQGQVCVMLNKQPVFAVDLPHWIEMCKKSLQYFK